MVATGGGDVASAAGTL